MVIQSSSLKTLVSGTSTLTGLSIFIRNDGLTRTTFKFGDLVLKKNAEPREVNYFLNGLVVLILAYLT